MSSSISGTSYYLSLFSGGLSSSYQNINPALFNSMYPVNTHYQAKDIKVCSIPTGMKMFFSACCGTSVIENLFNGQNGDFATPDEIKAQRISYYS